MDRSEARAISRARRSGRSREPRNARRPPARRPARCLGRRSRERRRSLSRASPRSARRGGLIGLVVLAWLATSLYRVQPDEKGVVLRFGQWVATTEPGLHVHLPYPIETVLLPKVTQVNQIQLGAGRRGPDRRPGEPRPADADRRREHRRG